MTLQEYDEGERAWEEWMDKCERIMSEQGIGAYKACGCETKTKATVRYETKSWSGRPASTRPQSHRATKSGWGPETMRMLQETKARPAGDDYTTRQLKAVQGMYQQHQEDQAAALGQARQEGARVRW